MSHHSASRPRHESTRGVDGWITHTELISTDPAFTKAWCANVLGWAFTTRVPLSDGAYHLFAYAEHGGGGIRAARTAAESPGSVPFVHVADVQSVFNKALQAGAESIQPPEVAIDGIYSAIVKAPGGVMLGFSGPSTSAR
jgi:predicted enzyme related to lactoylglutathione lyase